VEYLRAPSASCELPEEWRRTSIVADDAISLSNEHWSADVSPDFAVEIQMRCSR
jgi:hypothetical protein